MVEEHREPLSVVRDPEGFDKNIPGSTLSSMKVMQEKKNRMEAVSLRLAGLTTEQIADKLHLTPSAVEALIDRNFERRTARATDALRAVENARLDRAQAAIWTQVLEGDLRAVDSFLRISARRAKLNGLDEPTSINLSVGIRTEMEQALEELQQVVLGEVIEDVDDGGAGDAAGDEGADD